jgi:hypothetical protein
VILSWACSHDPQVGLLDGSGDLRPSYIPTWSTGTIRRTPHMGMLDCWVGSNFFSSVFFFFFYSIYYVSFWFFSIWTFFLEKVFLLKIWTFLTFSKFDFFRLNIFEKWTIFEVRQLWTPNIFFDWTILDNEFCFQNCFFSKFEQFAKFEYWTDFKYEYF